MLVEKTERDAAGLGLDHPIAAVGQAAGRELPDPGIIIDHENGLARRRKGRFRLYFESTGGSPSRDHVAAREKDLDPSPGGRTAEPHRAPRLLGDAIDLREAKAGPFAHFLRREEGIDG